MGENIMKKMLILSLTLSTSFIFAQKTVHDQLMDAVQKNDLAKAYAAIAAGANVNLPLLNIPVRHDVPHDPDPYINDSEESEHIYGNIFNATCLLVALLNNNSQMVSLLVENKANINACITFRGKQHIWTHIRGTSHGFDTLSITELYQTIPVWAFALTAQAYGVRFGKEIRTFLLDCQKKSTLPKIEQSAAPAA